MSDFNWDEHPVVENVDTTMNESFNWDDHPIEESKSQISQLESSLAGAANQFNWAPVVSAAIRHPIEAAEYTSNPILRLLGREEYKPEDTQDFEKSRNDSQKYFEEAEAANPWSYGLGNAAVGLLTTPFMPEVAGIKGAMALGAGMGALSGAGKAASKGESSGDIVLDSLQQGAMGGAFGGALGVAGKALSGTLANDLNTSASKNAAKALNISKPEVKKLLKAPTVFQNGEESANKVGSKLLSDGDLANRVEEIGSTVLKPTEFLNNEPIMTTLGNSKEVLERSFEAQQNSGEFIGNVVKHLDDNGNKSFSAKTVINEIEELQKDMMDKANPKLPKNTRVNDYNALEGLKQDIISYGEAPLSFKEAEEIKRDISNMAYNPNGSPRDTNFVKLRGFMNDQIEQAVDTAAKTLNDQELYQKYLRAKNVYGATKQIEKTLYGNAAGEYAGRDLGITDYMTGLSTMMAHGGLPAVAAIGAKKLLESKGNQVAAKGQLWAANKLQSLGNATEKLGVVGDGVKASADKMRSIGKSILDLRADQLKSYGNLFLSKNNPISKKFGQILTNLSEKDATGKNAAIYSMMQIPEYRQFLDRMTSDQPE